MNGHRAERSPIHWPGLVAVLAALLTRSLGAEPASGPASVGGITNAVARAEPTPFPIDLPTALRLAGADNFEVQLARERMLEARAIHEQARLRYFPWLAPGLGYRVHDGSLQDVGGRVFDVRKQSWSVGAALNAQVNYGEAIYEALAARQRERAAEQTHEARRRDVIWLAADRYFELARTAGAAGVLGEAVRLADSYAGQVRQAVDAGIAFRGDAFRADVQTRKNRVLERQAEEQRRVASARLAEALRLNPATDLMLPAQDLTPVTLTDTNRSIDSLIATALARRPELRSTFALAEAADAERRGAVRGPWIPTLGAQASLGGFGGGPGDHLGSLGDSPDYLVGLSWRLGSGGLLDRGRVRAAEARQRAGTIEVERVRLGIQREVVEAEARVRSLADQAELARQAVDAAQQLFGITGARREFGVGAVLEAILAEEELTRMRLEYVRIVAEQNRAQYALKRALGE